MSQMHPRLLSHQVSMQGDALVSTARHEEAPAEPSTGQPRAVAAEAPLPATEEVAMPEAQPPQPSVKLLLATLLPSDS